VESCVLEDVTLLDVVESWLPVVET
jgi:hypothetical protein